MSKKGNTVPLSGTAHFTDKMQRRLFTMFVDRPHGIFNIRGFLVGLGIAQQLAGENKELKKLFDAVKARENDEFMDRYALQRIIDSLEEGP